MAKIGIFKYDSTPIAAALWKNLGGNFHDLSQAICEFCDDSISNFNGNLTDGRIHFCLIGPLRKNAPKPQNPGGGIRISVS